MPAPAQDYVLIAEADARLASVYSELLSEEGFAVEVHRDGEAARAAMERRGPPALLVADVSLPRLDGFAVVRALRRIAPADQAPAVMTAASMELRTAAWNLKQQLGIAELLASNMSVGTIRGAFARALGRRAHTAVAVGEAARGQGRAVAPPVVPDVERPVTPPRHLDGARRAKMVASGLFEEGDETASEDRDLQKLVEATATQFGVPIALVSIVLNDRQWFKAHVGLAGDLLKDRGTPIADAFCRHVVDGDPPTPLIVPDARNHPAFVDNRLVKEGAVGSYAGAPLVTPDGDVLGSLCIIDSKPAAFTGEQVEALVATARRVAGLLELRSQARAVSAQRRSLTAARARVFAPSSFEPVIAGLDLGIGMLDDAGTIRYANPTLLTMMACEARDVVGQPRDVIVDRMMSLSGDPQLTRRLLLRPGGGGPYAAREDIELVRPQRRVLRWVSRPIVMDERIYQVGVLTDITVETVAREERERLAMLDSVTALPNRRAGQEALVREVARAKRHGRPLSFAMIDVDRFKTINDTYGHITGDAVLREVARVMNAALRTSDVATRWGGDEFALILPETPLESARAVVDRVRAAVAALRVDPVPGVTLSCGVAALAAGESDHEALLHRADEAVYAAKRAGRNAVR